MKSIAHNEGPGRKASFTPPPPLLSTLWAVCMVNVRCSSGEQLGCFISSSSTVATFPTEILSQCGFMHSRFILTNKMHLCFVQAPVEGHWRIAGSRYHGFLSPRGDKSHILVSHSRRTASCTNVETFPDIEPPLPMPGEYDSLTKGRLNKSPLTYPFTLVTLTCNGS